MLQCTWADAGACVKACTGGEKSIESIGALREVICAASAESQRAASTTLGAIIKEKDRESFFFTTSAALQR
jgi:hypothetical protein